MKTCDDLYNKVIKRSTWDSQINNEKKNTQVTIEIQINNSKEVIVI